MMTRMMLLIVGFAFVANLTQCHKKPPTLPAYHFAVSFVEGDCFLMNADKMKAIHQGLSIVSGDTLLTSYSGKMTISFNDSDYIVMDRNCKLSITTDDKLNVAVRIIHGKVYSNIVLLPRIGSYQTITPKVTTKVHGTAFTTEVDSLETAISVLEGTVAVTDRDSLCPIQVNRGERAIMNPGQFPCQVTTASLKELRDLVSWVGKSFIKFRKVIEYKNDLQYISKLKNLDMIPQELSREEEARASSLVRDLGGKPSVRVETQEIKKPTLSELSKAALPDEVLRMPEHIRELIKVNRVPFQRLYTQCMQKDGPFQGRVIVRFVIEPSGAVSEPSIVSSTTNNSVFDSLVVIRVLQLKFEPVKAPGNTSVVYPFEFTRE